MPNHFTTGYSTVQNPISYSMFHNLTKFTLYFPISFAGLAGASISEVIGCDRWIFRYEINYFIAYETRKFNATFTKTLQYHVS